MWSAASQLTTVHSFNLSIHTVRFHERFYEKLGEPIKTIIEMVLTDVKVEHSLGEENGKKYSKASQQIYTSVK